MGEIIPLWELKPHVNINVPGAVHVYPVRYFVDFAKGKDVEPIPQNILRVIVGEWVKALTKPEE